MEVKKMSKLSLVDMCYIIKNNFKCFIFSVLILLTIGSVYIFSISKKYTSIAEISINYDDYSSLFVGENFKAGLFGEFDIVIEIQNLRTISFLEKAISDLNINIYDSIDFDINKLKLDKFLIKPMVNTNTVKIAITDSNPIFATDLTNALAKNMQEYLWMLIQDRSTKEKTLPSRSSEKILMNDIVVINKATVPSEKSFPKDYALLVIVIIAAVIYGYVICFIRQKKNYKLFKRN